MAGLGWGLFNASLILNATANAEKLHNLLKSPLRDVHAQTHAHRNKETGKGRGGGGQRLSYTHIHKHAHTLIALENIRNTQTRIDNIMRKN